MARAVPAKASTTKPRAGKASGGKLAPEDFLKLLKQARNADPDQPLKAFEAAGISQTLLLSGTQQVRIKRLIDWLREEFFSGSTVGVSVYFGQDLQSANSVQTLIGSLANMSLFEPLRLIIIYDADKVKAAAAKPLAEALEKDHPGSLVVLTNESSTSKSPLASRLPKKTTIIEFKDLSPAILRKWAAKEIVLAGNNEGIEPKALDLLIESYGNDVSALSREIQKLTLLAAPNEKIASKHVQELSLRSPEVTSFELIQQVAKKNSPKAAVLTYDLLDQGLHPLQLCAFISRCVRTMLATKRLSSNQVEDSGLNSELTNGWFLRNLKGAGQHFSLEELKASIEILKDLDFRLKDTGLPDDLILATTIQKISVRSLH